MSIIYIVNSGGSLKNFYEDTLEYLYDTHHPRTPENHNFDLTPEMEDSAFFAEAALALMEESGEI